MTRPVEEDSWPPNPDTLKLVKDYPRQAITFAVARVPDSARCFLGGVRLQGLRGRPRRGEVRRRRNSYAHGSYVTGVALAGKMLVSGGYDGKLIWWDTEAAEQVRTVDAHAKWVRKVVASPDGKLVASVADDMVCKLWDAATGKLVHELRGHEPSRRRTTSRRCSTPSRSRPTASTSRPATRSATSSSGTCRDRQGGRDGRGAGHVHLGPGAAAALDRRHPVAGVLARTASCWRSAASARSATSTTWTARPASRSSTGGRRSRWRCSRRQVQGAGEPARSSPRTASGCSGPAGRATGSCCSSTRRSGRWSGRRRCRCTSTTSRWREDADALRRRAQQGGRVRTGLVIGRGDS